MIRCFILVLLAISGFLTARSQSQTTIQGRVIDTISQAPLVSATVSLYEQDNGKILKYGFTNNSGRFILSDVPLTDTVFQLRISSVGYHTFETNIIRSLTQTDINIGDIQMKSATNRIEEVHVKPPPIMMNQDTLVIHPEAFDLEPNAVVEDLLTKVPGIVIWGDGMITVNGKKVDKVLVEGKPFFGANPAIATRNLPADAIDKVKVYDSPSNHPEKKELESLEIDILLKNGKKRGLFGKVSLSEGTHKHKERTFLLNAFDPKNQISLFAGYNNTNKIAQNATDFLAAHVYKAGGEDLGSNTPRFDQRGLNDFFLAGTKFEHKWSDQLKSDLQLLHNDRKSNERTDVHEVRLLGEGSEQEIAENRENNRQDIRQSYLGTARYADKKWELKVHSNIQQTKTSQDQLYTRQVTDPSGLLSDLQKDMHDKERSRSGKLGFNLRQPDMLAPIKFGISYEFEAENRKKEQQENILFMQESPLDRLKQNSLGNSRHEMDATLGLDGLLREVAGIPRMGVSLDLNNSLKARQQHEDQQDFFYDDATGGYTHKNQAISYSDRLREIMWTPELSLAKGFSKQIGKGQNNWTFQTALGVETFSRKNASDHELRKIDQQNLHVLPSASIQYKQFRQLSSKSISLAYESLIRQPGVHDLIALIDTTQKDFNRLGNKNLLPEEQYQFSIKYNSSHISKNRTQNLNISYILRKNQQVNSSMYLPDGERVSQTVNTDGLPSFQANYYYKRGRIIAGRPLNISLVSMLNGGKRYYFNNDVRHKNAFARMSHRPEVQYVPFDRLKVSLLGSISTYWSSSGLNKTVTNSSSIGLDAVLTWPKRITWISRFERKNYSTKGLTADRFYFWNMDVYYRMLKKEQLEIKLSAYDILNSNKTILNTVRDNTMRRARINSIQQYFMIGLSYYPRMF